MSTIDRQGAGESEQIQVWPHRSLNRGGSRVLVGSVAAVFTAIAVWAANAGAWPVLAYAGLALCGFGCALSSNTRAARFAQVIELAPDRIRVSEVGPAGRRPRTHEFNPIWVRVVDVPGPWEERRLILRESGRTVVIGDFLSPEERSELASELRARIRRRYWGAV